MSERNLNVQDVRPFIGSKDVAQSRRFFEALGWEVVYKSDSLLVLKLGEHCFYLQNYYNKEWCENTMLHVSVDDFDHWYEFVQEQFANHDFGGDARIAGEPHDEGYGRVFQVFAPSGVLLHIATFYE